MIPWSKSRAANPGRPPASPWDWERLVALVQQGAVEQDGATDVYLVLAGEEARLEGMALAERLRDVQPGLGVVCNAGDGSFKSQFKRADRSGARLALVIAEDELRDGTVSVKFLREDRAQQTVAADKLPEWLGAWKQGGARHEDAASPA